MLKKGDKFKYGMFWYEVVKVNGNNVMAVCETQKFPERINLQVIEQYAKEIIKK